MPEEGKRRENTCLCCFSGGRQGQMHHIAPSFSPLPTISCPYFGPILKNSQTMSLQKAPVLYTDDSPRVGGREYPGCFSIDKVRQRLGKPLLMLQSEKVRQPLKGRWQQLKITSFQTALALLSMAIAIPHTAQRDHRVGRHGNNSTAGIRILQEISGILIGKACRTARGFYLHPNILYPLHLILIFIICHLPQRITKHALGITPNCRFFDLIVTHI